MSRAPPGSSPKTPFYRIARPRSIMISSLAIVLLGLASLAAHSSALLRPLEHVVESIPEDDLNVVSTDLSLGHDWSPAPAAHPASPRVAVAGDVASSSRGVSVHDGTASLPPPGLSREEISRLIDQAIADNAAADSDVNHHSPYGYVGSSSHSAPSAPPLAESSDTERSASDPSLLHATSNTVPFSPRIDLHFSRDPIFGQAIALPSRLTYIPSPWMEDVYSRICAFVRHRSAFRTTPEPVPAPMVELIDSQAATIFAKRGEVYLLPIPVEWLRPHGVEVGMEVLMRYHQHLRWPKEEISRIVTVWVSADKGGSLALVGTFHMPETGYRSLRLRFPGLKVWEVRQVAPDRSRSGLFLVPKT
ncbi:hypothetical protein PSEUBRA_004042 [Kalmanozyma brasiliensis GHG001]|uniref:uncharacterized protein n=1 Tax=Kalmanozyma brasiliensis (strain GHG001) TaxID=1365824 RepID=UPI002867B44A|nr:uncharacterized protein PSEUBRA_004042 [Kalmanozyma brasiliensis GHG001]KAF6767330.1 hypothetical protein PSEUBRA_004042 [Kalmanozyma brasiliensis GHG001]